MWEITRWATYPGDRLEVLINAIRAAGHEVQKIDCGKPIVKTLNDTDLELAACVARPGRSFEPGVLPPYPPADPPEIKPEPKKTTTRKRRKKKE